MNEQVTNVEVSIEEESVMTEQLALDPKVDNGPDPLDVSAMGFGLYFPVFKNMVNNKLSGTSAKRILLALFGNKLEDVKVNLKLEAEITALKIANKLFEDILVLHLGALMEAEQKRQDIINQNKQEVLNAGTETVASVSDSTNLPAVGSTTQAQ